MMKNLISAAAARKVLLTVAMLSLLAAPLTAFVEYNEDAGTLTFTYEDADADSVHITGDFTGWAEPGEAFEQENGVWTYTMEVAMDDTITYKYQVNEEYFDDVEAYSDDGVPGVRYVDDGFGGQNIQIDVFELAEADPDAEDAPFRPSIAFGQYTNLVSQTTFLTQDLATGEERGFEATDSRLKARSYWKLDAEVHEWLDTFIEIKAFDGDVVLYDMPGDASAEDPETGETADLDPAVSVVDGLENLGNVPFAPFYELNGQEQPELSHFKAGVTTPFVDLESAYINAQSTSSNAFLFETFDSDNAGDGYLEIEPGDAVPQPGDLVHVDGLVGLNRQQGVPGVYSWINVDLLDAYQVDLVYNAVMQEEEQLRYFYFDAVNTFGFGAGGDIVPGVLSTDAQVLATVDAYEEFDEQSLAYGLDLSLTPIDQFSLGLLAKWGGENVATIFGNDDSLETGDFFAEIRPRITPVEPLTVGLDTDFRTDNQFEGDLEFAFNPNTDIDLLGFGVTPLPVDLKLFSNLDLVVNDETEFDFVDAGTELSISDINPVLDNLTLGYTFTEGAADEGRAFVTADVAGPADPIDSMNFNLGWEDENVSLITQAGIGNLTPQLGVIGRLGEDENTPFGVAAGTTWDTPWRGGVGFAHMTYDFDPYEVDHASGGLDFGGEPIIQRTSGAGEAQLRLGITWDY